MSKIDIREIHIGSIIKECVSAREMKKSRICNFLNCSEKDIDRMFASKGLDVGILLRWSKLLQYDLFRIYSQHLILYAPQANTNYNNVAAQKKTARPQFRKNIYTKELIDFILERINKGEMTKLQVIKEYKIPKTTLYKWISKYMTLKN